MATKCRQVLISPRKLAKVEIFAKKLQASEAGFSIALILFLAFMSSISFAFLLNSCHLARVDNHPKENYKSIV